MRSAIILAANVAAVTAQLGSAQVQNFCPDAYSMAVVESVKTYGGPDDYSTLKPNGGSWSKPYSVATNSNGGWSVKIPSIITGNGCSPTNLLQFEYTYVPNDATHGGKPMVWYDNSLVDGKAQCFPDWKFVAPGADASAQPHDGVYLHPTDDARGMQPALPANINIILKLCPGNEGNSGVAAPAPAPAPPAPTPAPPAPAPAAPSPSPSSAFGGRRGGRGGGDRSGGRGGLNNIQVKAVQLDSVNGGSDNVPSNVQVVTEIETKIITAIVTETARARARRHALHRAH